MVKNQRNVHHHVVSGHWLGVIAHSEKSVLSTHPTLVTGEDDHCIFIEAVFLQSREDFTHTVVDSADLGGDASDANDVVVIVQIGILPGMSRVTWKGRKMLV